MSESTAGTFARRLREERGRAGLSQDDLAKELSARLGVTIYSTAVTKMEACTRSVKIDEAVAIADILQVPLLRLVGDVGDERYARVRRALHELENAEVLLRAAIEEVERREAEVEGARARLAELEHRDLAEDLRAEQWPMGD